MLIADHINYAGMNPLIGEPTDRRFVNMVDCYAPDLRAKSIALAERLDAWRAALSASIPEEPKDD
ncbi:MAG: hypothetical protein ACK4N1_19545 [Pseudorhizobium sp.]